MNLPCKRQVLVTSTVTPQTSFVSLQDPAVRLSQYLESIAFLARHCNVERITVVENSGNDFSVAARRAVGHVPLHFICYQENRRDIPVSALEAGMYSKFLKDNNFSADEIIVKITGRYCVRNFDKIFDKSDNLAVSFRPTFGLACARSVLTSAYQLDNKEFINWTKYLENANFDRPLEMLFAEFISSRTLRPQYVSYPEIEGYSGTFGTAYSAIYKERVRRGLSKLLPFGFCWRTPTHTVP